MKNKNLLLLNLVSLFLFTTLGCTMQKPVSDVDSVLKTASFNYSPKSTEPAGFAQIGIILISPSFDKIFEHGVKSPFTDFRSSIGGDLEEIITARGFTFRGPYNGYDEITYSDKLATDLVVEVEITPELKYVSSSPWKTKRHYHYSPYGAYYTYSYYLDSDISLTGKVKITFSEIMTHEKISIKNVEIASSVFHVSTTNSYKETRFSSTLSDVGVYNPLVTALNEAYQSILDKAWGFFDPLELKSWKPQIKELREQKRY